MTSKDGNNAPRRKLRVTRVIASTAGVLCGISGLEHGFFEILQGNTAPHALLIGVLHRIQQPPRADTSLDQAGLGDRS